MKGGTLCVIEISSLEQMKVWLEDVRNIVGKKLCLGRIQMKILPLNGGYEDYTQLSLLMNFSRTKIYSFILRNFAFTVMKSDDY